MSSHSPIDFRVYCRHSEISDAWRFFHQIRAMSKAQQQYPEAVSTHKDTLESIWRITYKALLLQLAAIFDDDRRTHSLTGLEHAIRKRGHKTLNIYCSQINRLAEMAKDQTTTIGKIFELRDKTLAHRNVEEATLAFQLRNRVFLHQIEEVLRSVDALITEIASATIGIKVSAQSTEDNVEPQFLHLIQCLAVSPQSPLSPCAR